MPWGFKTLVISRLSSSNLKTISALKTYPITRSHAILRQLSYSSKVQARDGSLEAPQLIGGDSNELRRRSRKPAGHDTGGGNSDNGGSGGSDSGSGGSDSSSGGSGGGGSSGIGGIGSGGSDHGSPPSGGSDHP
ncbi:hypothetical protein BOTBODRAFT_176247 [Botryobasidium botryosum FD-172 SS1]|uniref:Uncharacterized protein n=1 Tax=Botryobasidium botryosum (strain FD-172 SS1) TaxID=930990 RepID=A0A067MAF4_BOTB1|nr:hypothetical protein BOTBODRAFT_176247 [Botryobasidium botryosum FD-172 SS1]